MLHTWIRPVFGVIALHCRVTLASVVFRIIAFDVTERNAIAKLCMTHLILVREPVNRP
jgi:hypothetical protein